MIDYIVSAYIVGVLANTVSCVVFFVKNPVVQDRKNTITLVVLLCFCLPFLPAISILFFGRRE